VDRATIEANFIGNLEKLNKNFKIIDNLTIIDSSEIDHVLLLSIADKKILYAISNDLLSLWFKKYLFKIVETIY
jgi:hypothetical protein